MAMQMTYMQMTYMSGARLDPAGRRNLKALLAIRRQSYV
jgi:hypothetical protein